jgi:hypothetical protein
LINGLLEWKKQKSSKVSSPKLISAPASGWHLARPMPDSGSGGEKKLALFGSNPFSGQMNFTTFLFRGALLLAFLLSGLLSQAAQYVVYEGKKGPGQGKHVVLISGDEEYRSEESLPQLGKILAERHGFKCTVLLPLIPTTAASIRT